jgi:hypothetical protein
MKSTLLTFVDEVVPAKRPALGQALADLGQLAGQPPFLPFSQIPTLHFASVVLFDTRGFVPLLVLESNFDGELDTYLDQLVRAAEPWLGRLFGCCAGFPSSLPVPVALAEYLRGRVVRPAAFHVGNVGRTLVRIRQEAALRDDLSARIDDRLLAGARPADPEAAFALIDHERRTAGGYGWVGEPHARQTFTERVSPWARLVLTGSVALALTIALLPLTLPIAIILVLILRRHEMSDEPMRPDELDPAHVKLLADQEDHRIQNHLASMTVVKPGWFRRLTLRVVLWAANLLARISTKGSLSGIPSIHYAHWALVDRDRRLLFLSNFDGSWENYLDDFINKASAGLTAIWSNARGFPRTRFLVGQGARDGVAFKAFARQQQTPAAVWYTAYPSLTVQQIDSHSHLREGLASLPMGDALIGWLRRW